MTTPYQESIGLGRSNREFGWARTDFVDLGWGFLGVSRTALWQDSDRKENA